MKYIFLLLLIGASIGVFFMVIKPRYDSLQQLRDDVAAYDANLETAEKLKLSRDELIAKYNSIPKADLDNLKTLLPDSVDNIRLIIQIDSLATKNGLSILRNIAYQAAEEKKTTTAPAAATPATASAATMPGAMATGGLAAATTAGAYGEFTISFQTVGQYSNFLAFLSDLEQNLRLVDVAAVEFGASQGSQQGTGQQGGQSAQASTNSLSYKVTLKTYWLKK